VSRLTATAPPGGRRRTSNPGWPRGPPPVGASRRHLPTGCARRSPERSPGDGGSIPPTSTRRHETCPSSSTNAKQPRRRTRTRGARTDPIREWPGLRPHECRPIGVRAAHEPAGAGTSTDGLPPGYLSANPPTGFILGTPPADIPPRDRASPGQSLPVTAQGVRPRAHRATPAPQTASRDLRFEPGNDDGACHNSPATIHGL
jgi:hypothetical protein